MGGRRMQLELRRQALVLRSATLRVELTQQVSVLERPLALADEVRFCWRWLRQNPEVPVGIAVALVVARPSRAWRWARRGWGVWRLVRRARSLLA